MSRLTVLLVSKPLFYHCEVTGWRVGRDSDPKLINSTVSRITPIIPLHTWSVYIREISLDRNRSPVFQSSCILHKDFK